MKKNLYFRTVFARENNIKNLILNWAFALSSFPTLLLEVFIRKDFGERYFRMFSAVLAAIVLAFLPSFFAGISDIFQPVRRPSHSMFEAMPESGGFWLHYGTWYLFIALFLFFAYRRHLETKRNPSTFEFGKFSLYRGTINPIFDSMKWNGKLLDIRIIETVLEPLLFLVAGVFLWLMQQNVGILLIVCSIFYALGYEAAYVTGENFVLDKIDEMLANDALEKAFVDDAGADETKGFQYRGKKPKDAQNRRKLLPMMINEEEVVEAE